MKAFFRQFSSSVTPLVDRINWMKAVGNFVVVDPNNSFLILYLNPKAYNKLLVASLAADKELMTLATPEDDESSVRARFSVPRSPNAKGTPNLDCWMAPSSKLLSLISGWKIRESMINFKRNFEKFMPSYYLDLVSWSGLKTKRYSFAQIWKLSRSLNVIYRTRGINQVILRLKISQIVVLKFLAGERVVSTQDLGQRIKLTNGLPAWIPPYFRNFIRSTNIPQIRVIISLLSAYKGFMGKYGVPSLDSITSPMPILNYEEAWKNVIGFWTELGVKAKSLDTYPSRDHRLMTVTTGPNEKISFLGANWDAIAIVFGGNFEKWEDYNDFASQYRTSIDLKEAFRKDSLMRELWNTAQNFKQEILDEKIKVSDVFKLSRIKAIISSQSESPECLKFDEWRQTIHQNTDPPITWKQVEEFIIPVLRLGKLAIKLEPAGKIRVFAIVDFWSQWFLQPLHEELFSILSKHPCDATFDQIGRVQEFADRNYNFYASYDLKSATDMIPNTLYQVVLSYPTSVEFAKSWIELLVHRDYCYTIHTKDKEKHFQDYKYSRGQPMGALSSWAGLAVVHHFVVYMAARRLNLSRFRDYLVLGDDIVIADKAVAHSYLEVCKDFGIPIGLPKSFVSDSERFFQFASQDLLNGVNISPYSLREALAASGYSYFFGQDFNLSKILEFAKRAEKKGIVDLMNFTDLLRSVSTHTAMKQYKILLTRGFFPEKAKNYIVALLARSPETFANKISLDQLIASIRGDIRLFTNHAKYSEVERLKYLRGILILLTSQIKKDLSEFSRYSMPGDIDVSSETMKILYRKVAAQRQEDYTSRFSSIRSESLTLIKELQDFIVAQSFGLDITKDESNLNIVESNKLLRLLTLQKELRSIMIKRDIVVKQVSTFGSTKRPYLLNLHLSLLNEMSFR